MLATRQNVKHAIHSRFKGADLQIAGGNNAEGWRVMFMAPENRTWIDGSTNQIFESKPNTNKQELWNGCFEFIKQLPELEPIVEFKAEIPQEAAVDNTPEETKHDVRHPDFRLPTGEDLDDAIKFLGLNYVEFCSMFGVTIRVLRGYRQNSVPVPYALWRLVLIYSGKVEI